MTRSLRLAHLVLFIVMTVSLGGLLSLILTHRRPPPVTADWVSSLPCDLSSPERLLALDLDSGGWPGGRIELLEAHRRVYLRLHPGRTVIYPEVLVYWSPPGEGFSNLPAAAELLGSWLPSPCRPLELPQRLLEQPGEIWLWGLARRELVGWVALEARPRTRGRKQP